MPEFVPFFPKAEEETLPQDTPLVPPDMELCHWHHEGPEEPHLEKGPLTKNLQLS